MNLLTWTGKLFHHPPDLPEGHAASSGRGPFLGSRCFWSRRAVPSPDSRSKVGGGAGCIIISNDYIFA